jgi:hypothetical protein
MSILFQGAAVSISGPGRGDSEGQSSDPLNWIRTIPFVQNSWLYQYAYAGMRGMTYLLTWPDLDREWVGYTGVSAGGLMTFLDASVDTRCTFSMPLIACGSWANAADCDNAWFFQVLGEDTIPRDDPRVLRLVNFLDPIQYCGRHDVPSLLIIGSQDEFFPINSLANFWAHYATGDKRLLIVANFDHGVYYTDDPEYAGRYDAFDNTARFEELSVNTMATWFIGTKNETGIPPMPEVDADYSGGEIDFEADVALAYTGNVFVWVSTDSGWTYHSTEMHRLLPGLPYEATVPVPAGYDLSNTIYFVEANGSAFTYTSVPWVPIPPKLRPGPDEPLAVEASPRPENLDLRVYPNPFNSKVEIRIQNSEDRIEKIEIYDIEGKKVFTEIVGANRRFAQGQPSVDPYETVWQPAPYIPSGIYLVRAKIGNSEIAKRMVYLK